MLKALVFVGRRCPYCSYFKKVVDKLKNRFPEVSFEFIDVEDNVEFAKKFEIEMLPTTILLEGDEILGGIMGFVDEKTAEKSLKEQLRSLRGKR